MFVSYCSVSLRPLLVATALHDAIEFATSMNTQAIRKSPGRGSQVLGCACSVRLNLSNLSNLLKLTSDLVVLGEWRPGGSHHHTRSDLNRTQVTSHVLPPSNFDLSFFQVFKFERLVVVVTTRGLSALQYAKLSIWGGSSIR